jgi:hypothetical protein
MTRHAVDKVIGEFDFDLLTEEERNEFIRLMDTAVPKRWTLTPKQQFANAVWQHVD